MLDLRPPPKARWKKHGVALTFGRGNRKFCPGPTKLYGRPESVYHFWVRIKLEYTISYLHQSSVCNNDLRLLVARVIQRIINA